MYDFWLKQISYKLNKYSILITLMNSLYHIQNPSEGHVYGYQGGFSPVSDRSDIHKKSRLIQNSNKICYIVVSTCALATTCSCWKEQRTEWMKMGQISNISICPHSAWAKHKFALKGVYCTFFLLFFYFLAIQFT